MSSDGITVLLYGDFLWDRLAASYERAFVELGHRVVRADVRTMAPNLAPWIRHRVAHRLSIGSLELRRRASHGWNAAVVRTVAEERPHLALVLNGDFLMPESVRRIRSMGTLTFIFHADTPLPPHPSSRPEALPCARESDCYLIWSRRLQERLIALGVPRVEYHCFAWDPAVFPYEPPQACQEGDVVFVGGWDAHRERFLEPIAQRYNLRIWGPGYWGTRSAPRSAVRRCWQGRALTGVEAADVLRRSGIVLNVLRAQNLPDGVNMRTFEVPGCGGFQLSTRTEGATEILPDGIAGAYFSDVRECIQSIEYYLARPRERGAIAERAHGIVAGSHRYLDRAREVVQLYRACADQAPVVSRQ